jgi:DNA-binding response OmpR family regulator
MKKKIMLVEDTPDLLENLTDTLRMEGYEVTTATNGIEALEILSAKIPDLIITDLLMPKMDGFTLVKKIKTMQNLHKVPLMVFSAKPINDKEAGEIGANVYVKKPCAIENLLKSIHEIIYG